jgi:ribosomal protein S18 acetylase RimI-like enzyme
MKADDWEEVSKLDTLAFNAYFQKTGRETRIHHRTQANLTASLALHPKGCFVAKKDKLVGYILSRIWGKLGWIGTFGVDPDFHSQGIGKRLLTQAVESLKESGCAIIGLETMPDSPYNVGLYAKSGFSPSYPTLYLTKPSKSIVSVPSFKLFSKVNEQTAAAFISSLSQSVNPMVDYVVEVKNAKEYSWGDTLLFGWPEPYGFSLVRSVSILQGSPQPICSIICLVLHPKARRHLVEVLKLLQSYAYKNQASQIILPVNAIDSEVLQVAVTNGFYINGLMLRMIYQGKYLSPKGIDMARWAM